MIIDSLGYEDCICRRRHILKEKTWHDLVVCLLQRDVMRNVEREYICKHTGLGYLSTCYTQVVCILLSVLLLVEVLNIYSF